MDISGCLFPNMVRINFWPIPIWLRLSTCTLLDSKLVCTGASEIRHLKEGQLVTVVHMKWHDSSHGTISREPFQWNQCPRSWGCCAVHWVSRCKKWKSRKSYRSKADADHGSHGKNGRIVEQLCNFMMTSCANYILININYIMYELHLM